MNMETVIDQILLMNNDQLNAVIDAVKQRRNWNARQVTRGMRVGDRVSFHNRNAKMIGTVTKVNRKTVIVQSVATNQLWKVSASLLTLEDA